MNVVVRLISSRGSAPSLMMYASSCAMTGASCSVVKMPLISLMAFRYEIVAMLHGSAGSLYRVIDRSKLKSSVSSPPTTSLLIVSVPSS